MGKQESARRIVALMKESSRRRPAIVSSVPAGRFRVVDPPEQLLDAVTRNAYLMRIRTVRDGYRLHWLVNQESFGVSALECLDDATLIDMLQKLEKARECITEGISFEDAGLVINPLGD